VDASQPECPYLPELVLGQCFRRVQKESPARGALQGVLERWDLVAERLAARGGGSDDHVLPCAHPLVGLALVGVQELDAYLREGGGELRVQLRQPDEVRGAGRKARDGLSQGIDRAAAHPGEGTWPTGLRPGVTLHHNDLVRTKSRDSEPGVAPLFFGSNYPRSHADRRRRGPE
jgi:hypothetical protein